MCGWLCVSDVVYLGNIHPHHLSVGVLFMNAKKNVLCEKPLAMNLKEVQELIASAKKNNVFLMEVSRRFLQITNSHFIQNNRKLLYCHFLSI